MAGTNKFAANQLFGKISAYSTIVQQNLGKYLNKLSPYAKEYESTLDLVLDILRTLGYSEERLVAELLEVVTGDASIGAAIEAGYHGALNSLESKLALIETKQNNDSFIYKLEDAVKVTISSILTSFLSCSISPFIPMESLDTYYAWQNLYDLEYANGNRIGGFVATLENKDISWEKNGMLNIGLEGALLDSRIRFSVEYFNKKTKDMLLNYPMALSTGFSGYYANVGNMRNTGWEFMLSGMLVKSKDIQWTLTWMGTAQKNKVLKLTKESNQILNGIRIIKEGYDVNTFYMARSAGIDPASGAQLYYAYDDMDDNGVAYLVEYDEDGNEISRTPGEYITNDYTKAVNSKYFVGKRTPDLYGSLSTDLKLFNCLDFSVMTTYSIGGKIYDSLYYGSMFNQYAGNTWNKNILRRWQKPGDITDIPRVELNAARTVTSNYLVDASYFAIKNITLGYTLPGKVARKIAMNSVRLYVSYDNVALFTHLKGMDPQYNMTGGTNYTYTPNKNLTVGLDINF